MKAELKIGDVVTIATNGKYMSQRRLEAMGSIIPRNDRVLVQREQEADKIGSIHIPDSAQEKSYRGKVLAVGPGKMVEGVNGDMVRRPCEVKPGDTVIFSSKWNDLAADHYSTTSSEEFFSSADRDRLHLIQEADVIAICQTKALTGKAIGS